MCCVFVNGLVKQFAIWLRVVVNFLLNVMEVFSVGGGALLDGRVWSSKECACSIGFVYVFVCRKLSTYKNINKPYGRNPQMHTGITCTTEYLNPH